jgi:hypothetical protein
MSSPASPQEEPQDHSNLEAIRAMRLEKVEQLKALGQNPYAYHWSLPTTPPNSRRNLLTCLLVKKSI